MGRTAETCPCRALRTWLEAAGITDDANADGPVFRSMNNKGEVSLAHNGVLFLDELLYGRQYLYVASQI